MTHSKRLRRVAHLDMDAFYASVELLRYPELRGLPVVIGGHSDGPVRDDSGQYQFSRLRGYSGRGVVTTATYEAREYGVFSATPMMRAAELAPDAILLPVDFARYRTFSRRFKQAVAALTPVIEDRGIDEIYIDLTPHPEPALELASRLQSAVKEATGLTCSIGVAANKMLAKIASDLNKPDGVTILSDQDLQEVIWPLPVSRINGVGPKATARLADLDIHSIADAANADPAVLQKRFGTRFARWLLQAAHGHDDRPVVTDPEVKSISRETTFKRDLDVVRDRPELSDTFLRLCEQLEADLRRKDCRGRTVSIKLRFDDFSTVTRDVTLPEPVDDAAAIHGAAGQCLKRVTFDRRIRLFGVRVSNLHVRTDDAASGPSMQQLQFDY
ncbi:MAG TPA: DNA polymerase IV [Burkholderiaceae bacterium]|nr:DNA polymerase IV [Burkholderiaceae bacterium]